MLLFFITCFFPFILFRDSLSLNPPPSWASEMRLLSICFWKDFSIVQIITEAILASTSALSFKSRMLLKKKGSSSKVDSFDFHSASAISVLDLPDLVLESVLEKLTPEALCRMATVCSPLMDMCVSDHLWERHVKNKWGEIIGDSAFKLWKKCAHANSNKGSIFGGDGIDHHQQKNNAGLMGFVSLLWPFAFVQPSKFITSSISSKKRDSNIDSSSIMSFYLALESGKFWFPAQVYNRENGHVGFMLSCYDAELSYDRKTDTFQARYPPHGRKASPIETGVTWDRIRASPFKTSPFDLHVSDCLKELRPGEQVEIQWRRTKGFPYGWWYGVVGHLETCEGNANYCLCHRSDSIVVEFKQYTQGSRWRTTILDRRSHKEEGNESDGFYGGIRKIRSDEERSAWKKMWPVEILE